MNPGGDGIGKSGGPPTAGHSSTTAEGLKRCGVDGTQAAVALVELVVTSDTLWSTTPSDCAFEGAVAVGDVDGLVVEHALARHCQRISSQRFPRARRAER